MATQDEKVAIGVLQEQMKTLDERSKATDIKVDLILEKLENTYVQKKEFNAFKWTTIPITIITTAVITSLIAFYFSHNKLGANSPTTGTTTTVNTPTGSTSTTSTKDGNPGSSSTATARSDSAKPSDSQSVTDGVVDQVKKVAN